MKRSQGFSLLELLVVLLIVGLFSAMSVAWLDAGPAPLERALEQLAAQARAHADQARHSGQVSGLRWNGRQPEFVRLQTGGGATRWVVDSHVTPDWPEALKADWPASSEPKVVFTANGVASPATLDWHWAEGRERWQWLSDSRLSRTQLP